MLGDVGHVVEVRMKAFFSQDLSLVLDSNRFDPQVFIQGRLSYKTAHAIGTIIIIGIQHAYYVMDPCSNQVGSTLDQPQLKMRNSGPEKIS